MNSNSLFFRAAGNIFTEGINYVKLTVLLSFFISPRTGKNYLGVTSGHRLAPGPYFLQYIKHVFSTFVVFKDLGNLYTQQEEAQTTLSHTLN